MEHTAIINIALRSASIAAQIMQDIALDLGVTITQMHSMAYEAVSLDGDYENTEDLMGDLECALLAYDNINIEDITVTYE
jgi:hypothetical protein